MTDETTRTAEDEFYDDAQDQFVGKEDLKDRLVAIWVTGKKGERKSKDGKMYPWVETRVLVLDDGPDGKAAESAIEDGEIRENRIGPAAGAEILENFQWSTGGMVSRLLPRIGKTHKPMVGRINSRKNQQQGYSASWSIAQPTEADRAIIRPWNPKLKAITDEMAAADDASAFDAS